ncbi:hypothetical protein [Pseudomonas laurylsulfatiphila]|uniref:Uncharacterized protein n=1 Tax=Pseudomonas laurylsulfatiphila TaxID=2011015 RepID=A0A2S6FGC2_9PSED|nr:hypothetical protein [Pseudomonas laurylsulfatiphila]PPK36509.1 hypothetical protein CD175_23130 [Pseudomonas laurylsulfatiphila]
MAIFQMILFFMGRPMHSDLAKAPQGTAMELHSPGTFNARNAIANAGRTLIGAKHAQRSRGGQAACPVQFIAV